MVDDNDLTALSDKDSRALRMGDPAWGICIGATVLVPTPFTLGGGFGVRVTDKVPVRSHWLCSFPARLQQNFSQMSWRGCDGLRVHRARNTK